jgi:NADH-quinone oxidoreductase subunit E
MLRRLSKHQPDGFAFTPDNQTWAEAQITKYPEGRQASAIIPLLWRAQEQEGWLTRPAIEHVADRLDMAYIRALEVATFYFMFHLHPVGSVAHVQVCGTLSCMLCGAEDLIGVCRSKIAPEPHMLSADGRFSWEEVECLGACANAPMAQIGKDYYEDLTAERLSVLLDDMAVGKVPMPGPQNGRFASEPASGLTSLKAHEGGRMAHNASVALALAQRDTLKRIDGTEVPLTAPWQGKPEKPSRGEKHPEPRPAEGKPVSRNGVTEQEAEASPVGKPRADARPDPQSVAEARDIKQPIPQAPAAAAAEIGVRPARLDAARAGGPDDLKRIRGIGPKLERLLHSLGFYHFDQVAGWTAAEVAWVDDNLEGFRGRVSRDDWVAQAKILASGGETEFSKRAKY